VSDAPGAAENQHHSPELKGYRDSGIRMIENHIEEGHGRKHQAAQPPHEPFPESQNRHPNGADTVAQSSKDDGQHLELSQRHGDSPRSAGNSQVQYGSGSEDFGGFNLDCGETGNDLGVGASGGEALMRSLGTSVGSQRVVGVTLLGSHAQLQFRQQPDGLHIQLPAKNPGKYAYSLRIAFEGR
jgi:hypothetical protein